MPARVGAELGIVSEQVQKLARGQAVTFTAEQLASFFPLGVEQHPSLPAAYTADAYVLTGDNTLTAAES
jgi:hypothetical protein